MSHQSAVAEYDELDSVRVHEPGFEAQLGAFDCARNHFARPFSVREAKQEHREIVSVLQSEGVDVRYLHEELDEAGVFDELLESSVGIDESLARSDREDLLGNIENLAAYEQLLCLLLRPEFGIDLGGDRSKGAPSRSTGETDTSVRIQKALTNIYFQRDNQILGDKGPIIPRPPSPTRQREIPLIEAAWRGSGAEIAHYTSDNETLEGGDFIPAGEFALLGVSAIDEQGRETVLRTSYDAGKEILNAGAVGYDEFGLVRQPLDADERLADQHDTSPRLLHLDGWFNIAAEGLAVARKPLVEAATVDVFSRQGAEYTHQRTESLAELLDRHDYEIIDAPYPERWATNFLTIRDGVVLPIYETDDGEYRAEDNETIEQLKAEGVEVVPDGCGVNPEQLTNGGGGIHCMTSPVNRSG